MPRHHASHSAPHLAAIVLGAVLLVGLGSALALPPAPAAAQLSPHASTPYALTVYSAPDSAQTIVGVLAPHAEVVLEARTADAQWVLGHATDGSVRGWMRDARLSYADGASALGLPVSQETIYLPAPDAFPPAYPAIRLNDFSITPTNLGQARAIFERGRALGANPAVVSKIGDCISDNQYFLSPFGWMPYDLGVYSDLQGVIDYFHDSLAVTSLAAFDGLVTSAVLDPLFANPMACEPGETPLRCEYRVHRPAVAIVMFGAQDLLFTPPDQFNRNLRQIVHETIAAGVVPVLSTFPGNLSQWEDAIQYNQIVVQVALDYDIPLMNLWRALEPLPNHGLNEDGRHLSLPLTDAADLTMPNLQQGYTMRNLVTLQSLDAVWRGAMQ